MNVIGHDRWALPRSGDDRLPLLSVAPGRVDPAAAVEDEEEVLPPPPHPTTGSADRTRPHREPHGPTRIRRPRQRHRPHRQRHPSPATSPHPNTPVNPGRSTVVRMPGIAAHTAGTALTARFAV